MRDVEIDEAAFEMIDVEDFLMLLRDPIPFQFDESGLMDLFENQDLFDPRAIFYDAKMIDKIRAGEKNFSKKTFIPMTEKRCTAEFNVNDDDEEYYKVNITVDSKCMMHPMITTNIELYEVLNKETMGLARYIVTNKISQRVHQSSEIRNHEVRLTVEFVEFKKIFDEPLEVIDDIEDILDGDQPSTQDEEEDEEDQTEEKQEKDEL